VSGSHPVSLFEILTARERMNEVIRRIAVGGGLLDRSRIQRIADNYFDLMSPRPEIKVLR